MTGKQIDGGLFAAKPNSVTLGIDQSYTGFAITAYDLKSDTHHTWVQRFAGTGVTRLLAIKEYIEDVLAELERNGISVHDIAMEGYAYSSQMGHMSGELGGLVKVTIFAILRLFPLIVPPASLKKYVTGKGTGVAKNQMLLHTFKKWGVEFDDDNAADSYGLARLVSGRADTAYEQEIVTKLADPKFREKP